MRNDNYRLYTEEEVDQIIANCEQKFKENVLGNILIGIGIGFPIWTILTWLTL